MPTVNIPNIGVVNFPDDMSPVQIQTAIESDPSFNLGSQTSQDIPVENQSGFFGNALRGAGERAMDLVGGFTQLPGQIANNLPGSNYGVYIDGDGIRFRDDLQRQDFATSQFGEAMRETDLGYDERASWQDVKDDPSLGTVLPFIAEQGVKSIPDMAAALTQLPAYVLSRTGEISENRAEAHGRQDPNIDDIGISGAAATMMAVLEKFGAEKLINPVSKGIGTGRGMAEGGVKGAIAEGGTEAIQEPIELLASSVIDKLTPEQFADASLSGLVAGGGMGAPIGTATGGIQGSRENNIIEEMVNIYNEQKEGVPNVNKPSVPTSFPDQAMNSYPGYVDGINFDKGPVPKPEFNPELLNGVNSTGQDNSIDFVPNVPQAPDIQLESLNQYSNGVDFVPTKVNQKSAFIPDTSLGARGEQQNGTIDYKQVPPSPENVENLQAQHSRDQRMPKGLDDSRILREDYRQELSHLATQLTSKDEGNMALIGGEFDLGNENLPRNKETPVQRTPSQNPEWFQRMNQDPDMRVSVSDVRSGVKKALAGETLYAKESRAVQFMLDDIQGGREERVDHAQEQLQRARDIRKHGAPLDVTDEYADMAGQIFDEQEYNKIEGWSELENSSVNDNISSYDRDTGSLQNNGQDNQVVNEPDLDNGEGQIDLFNIESEEKSDQEASRQVRRFAQVNNVPVESFRSNISIVNDADDALSIVAPIRKKAQEQLIALVVDKDGKPLEIIRHVIGTSDAAMTEFSKLLGAIHAVTDASKVWFAHNHPSGVQQQSESDHALTNELSSLLKGTGITVEAMLTVAPGSKTGDLYIDGYSGASSIKPTDRTSNASIDVPITERQYRRIKNKKDVEAVTSPEQARDIVEKYFPDDETGLLLLDNRHRVSGVLPMSNTEMNKLRTGKTGTGASKLLEEIHSTGAMAMIAKATYLPTSENIAAFGRDIKIRMLDSFVKDLDGSYYSTAERGTNNPHEGKYYSRAKVKPATILKANNLKKIIAGISKKWKNAPKVEIVDSANDLLGSDHPLDTEGALIDGTIYLVADNLPNQKRAVEVMLHEAIGHNGVNTLLGDYANTFFDQMASDLGNDTFADIAEDYELDMDNEADRRTAAQEYVARTAESGKPDVWLDRLIGKIREWLRSVMPHMKFNDADIKTLIEKSKKFVEEGTIEPGELGVQYSRRSGVKTGRKQQGYISDEGSGKKPPENISDIDKGKITDLFHGKAKPVADMAYAIGKIFYFRPVQVIRDINTPAAKKLADMIYKEERNEYREIEGIDLIQNRTKMEGEYGQRMDDIIESLSGRLGIKKTDTEAIVKGLNSENGSVPKRLEKEAQAVRKLLDDVHQYMVDAGVEIGYEKNYFPRVYDTDNLLNPIMKKRFIKLLTDHGYSTPESTYNKIIGSDQGIYDPERMSERVQVDNHGTVYVQRAMGIEGRASKTSQEKSRSIDIEYDLLKPFLVNELDSVLARYIHHSTRRAEYSRAFGDKEQQLNSIVKEIIDDYEAGKVDSSISMKEAVNTIYDLADSLQGRGPRFESEILNKASRLVSSLETMIHLPLVAMASFPETLAPAVHGGTLKSLPSYARGIGDGILEATAAADKFITGKRHIPKSELRRDAERMGVITVRSLQEAWTRRWGGHSGRVTSKFMRATMLEQLTNIQRLVAFDMARHVIKDYSVEIEKGKNVDQNLMELKDFGLDEADMKLVAKGEVSQALNDKIDFAAQRWAQKVITDPNEATTPPIMKHPGWNLVFQFKRFITVFSNTFLKSMLQNIGRFPNWEDKARFVVPMIVSIATAYYAQYWRDWLKYGDANPAFRKLQDSNGRIYDAVDRAGFTGDLTTIYQFANPYRFGHSNWKGRLYNLLGPAAGDISRVLTSLDRDTTKKSQREKQAKEVVNMIPGVNATHFTRKPAQKMVENLIK